MQKLNFLVVDDASFIRDLVKRTLKSQFTQCKIDEAVNGKKAQSLLAKNSYDLILCDWEMPEMSGLEVLTWLRATEKENGSPKSPFMMVTSRGDKSHVIKAVESGVSDYIGKPFNSEQLMKKVFKLLAVKHRDLIHAILKGSAAMAPSSGTGNDSANVLTAKAVSAPTASKPAAGGGSASLLTAGSVSSKLTNDGSTNGSNKPAARSGKAILAKVNLRTPTHQFVGSVKDINLTGASIQIDFAEKTPPAVLEQVVVDIVSKKRPDSPARINTIVTSIALREKSLECHTATIYIHVVDDDQDKLEILSYFVAEVR